MANDSPEVKDKALLAGGLRLDNLEEALSIGTKGLDLNSGLEYAPGRKDASLIAQAFSTIRNYTHRKKRTMTVSRETLLPAYFGEFGGQFVPESLIPALDQLEKAFVDAQNDPAFREELSALLRDYLGRPTPITEARNLGVKRASSSSGKTSYTVEHTRQTRFLVRHCWQSGWGRHALLRRPERASTAPLLHSLAHCWILSVWSTWVRKTWSASSQTYSVWS